MTDIQLSEAACDNLKVFYGVPTIAGDVSMSWKAAGFPAPPYLAEFDNSNPQDIGQETFSTDTLEGGLPDD